MNKIVKKRTFNLYLKRATSKKLFVFSSKTSFSPKPPIVTHTTPLWFRPIKLKFLPQILWSVRQRCNRPYSFLTFLSGFIGFWTSKTWVWQKPLRIFFIKKKESEIFEKAQNCLWDLAVGMFKKIFSQIEQILMGSYSVKMRTYGKPEFFIKNYENRLRKFFPWTCVSSY